MTVEAKDFFERVDEKSLRDRVAANVRDAIEAGALRPGAHIVESEIANQMGISRAPVREAIRLLEQEGFLISIPRKGSFVVELGRRDLVEIYSLRAARANMAINLALPH